MKLITHWRGKSQFEAGDGQTTGLMDAKPPLGDGAALSPKQLCLAAITGCSGVDITGLMRKHKQNLTSLRIEADAPVREGYPATFTEVSLSFFFEGEVDPARALESVVLSQTKYCGVSAMMAAHCPIFYRVFLNGSEIGHGQADFPR